MSWWMLPAAAISFLGQRHANNARKAEAARDRAFQERMSSSSWQRGVQDMTDAGLNPALAYGRGGASSPGGAMASFESETEAGVSNAMDAARVRKELKLLDWQIKKTESEAGQAHSEHVIKRTEADMAGERWRFYFTPNGSPKGPLRELLAQQHSGSMASSARNVTDLELAKLSIPERQAVSRLFDQVGSGGKGAQLIMPLLLQLLRR